MEEQNTVCCPKFEPGKWDKKTFDWDNKPFIKASVPTFFHIPLPSMISKRMTIMCDLADKAEANIPDLSDALVLFHDPSAFRSEIFYSVTKHVEGAHNTTLSGKFMAGVYEGPYKSVPKHMKAMNAYLEDKGLKAEDYYVHYAYCPGCAKKFGKNYMILFAEI